MFQSEEMFTMTQRSALTTVVASVLAVCTAALLAAQATAPTLKDPSTLTEQAPEKYNVRVETNQGVFNIEVNRSWSPRGADRFYNLVKNGFYDNNRFFRVLEQAMMQWGINGDPAINDAFHGTRILDDVPKMSNEKRYVTFASGGPNTRSTQVFVNLRDNTPLDKAGFTPFGRVTSGLDTLEKIYSGYGDGPPSGKGPEQAKILAEGNAYLTKSFPKLDYIKTATLVELKK
jgi:peptidyl-prolyl cis-trans isomerase A (cyclophilin A)